MNKSLLIVASLALGTAAVAQDTQAPATPDASQSMSTQTPAEQGSTPSESSQSPAMQTPPTGGDTTGMTPPAGGDHGGAMGTQSNNGMSTQSNTGMGMQSGTGMSSGTQAAAVDTSNYPKCGKGVTDKCVQAGGNGGGTHKSMRHHRMTKHK